MFEINEDTISARRPLLGRFRREVELVVLLVARFEAGVEILVGDHNGCLEFDLVQPAGRRNRNRCWRISWSRCWSGSSLAGLGRLRGRRRRIRHERRRRLHRKLALLVVDVEVDGRHDGAGEPLAGSARLAAEEAARAEGRRNPGERDVVLVQVVPVGAGRTAIDWARIGARQEVAYHGAGGRIVGLNDEAAEVALGRVGGYVHGHVLAGRVAVRGLGDEELRRRGRLGSVEAVERAQVEAGQRGRA